MLFSFNSIHIPLKYSSKQATSSCTSSILFIFSLMLLESFKFLIYQQMCFLISLIAIYSPFSLIASSKCSLIISNFCSSEIFFCIFPFNSFIILFISQGLPQICSSYHYSVYTCIVDHFFNIFTIFYVSISNNRNTYTFFNLLYNI